MANYFYSQVSIPYFTGLAKDVVTNTFHWQWLDVTNPSTSDFNTLRDAHKAFYEYIFSSGSGVQMAQWARPALTKFRLYDMVQMRPRVPVRDETMALTVGQDTAGNINPETALCISYRANALPGEARARLRGRIYLGALGNSCQGVGGASLFPAPSSLCITRAAAAAKTLSDLRLTTNWRWCVYSPTTGQTEPYDISFRPIASGWVDNAWDTQRRRGNAPSARTTW